MCWLSTDYPRNACTDAAAAGGFHFDGENTAEARIDREEGGCGEQFESIAWAGWLVETLGTCWAFDLSDAKRFPVPQDNFVPVATSSYGLVGCWDTDRCEVLRGRSGDPFQDPWLAGARPSCLWENASSNVL